MKRCPVCKAGLRGAAVCRRCGVDLSPVYRAAEDARAHYRAAREAFLRNAPQTMLAHAEAAFSKRQSPATGRLLACAAMLSGRYSLALRIWRQLESPWAEG